MQLQKCQKNNLTISQYLGKIKSFANELAAGGKPFAQLEFNVIALHQLPPEYHKIVVTVSTRLEPISFFELHSLLTSYEILIIGIHTSAMEVNIA